MMQAQIPQELSALMALRQGMQQGRVAATTPDGAPTVAAQEVGQVEQGMMMPGMQQAVGQAGLGAQIKAMQMQQAQEQLMNAAMRQQGPAGIESLNPQIPGFKEGGIVGYAEAGMVSPEFGGDAPVDNSEPRLRVPTPQGDRMMTVSEMRAANYPEDYIRRRLEMEGMISRRAAPAPMAPAASPATAPATPVAVATPVAAPQVQMQRPPAPMMPTASQKPAGMSSEQLFERARAGIESLPREPVAPSQAIAPALEAQRAMDEYRRQMGLPGEMDRVSQQEAAFKKLMADREAILNRRMQEVQAQQDRGSLAQYLMGFRQMKGQSVGQGLMSGSQAAQAYESGLRAQFERIEDLKIDLQALSVEKQNALDKMRDDIAKGKFEDAMKRREQAQRADAEIKAKKAEIDVAQAKAVAQKEEAQYRAGQPGELERLLGRLDTLRRTDPAAAEKLAEDIAVLRGAGRRPSGPEARQRMLEQYADNWEKMDLMEKKQLIEQGIKTYEDYVKYRDRIAGVAPTGGGSSSGQVLRFDERGNLIK